MYVIEKYRELKMGTSLFSDFYSEFIQLVSDLEYFSKMLIWEFKHKLMKEGRCFNCKRKKYIILNCPKKTKISAISVFSNINNIENIN